jgi:hypothetical protein
MSKTQKHTPGPLTIKYGDGWCTIRPDDGHGKIATVHMRRSKPNNTEELDANAHLFAAAPDLLAASEVAFQNLQFRSETKQKWTLRDQAAFEILEAAIAKATGGATQ